MQVTFPGVEFLRILFKFKKKKENSSSYVHVLHKIRRFHVIVAQWTSKKCTKKRDARAELLFWSLNLLFFEVVVVVVVVVEEVSINNEYEYENDFKPYSYSKSFSQLSMLAMTPSSSL